MIAPTSHYGCGDDTCVACYGDEEWQETQEITWTLEDDFMATLDGWGLFECGGTDHAPLELQRIDAPDDPRATVFDSDERAWVHVTARARAGSPLHQKALAFLMQESIDEYNEIIRYTQPKGA